MELGPEIWTRTHVFGQRGSMGRPVRALLPRPRRLRSSPAPRHTWEQLNAECVTASAGGHSRRLEAVGRGVRSEPTARARAGRCSRDGPPPSPSTSASDRPRRQPRPAVGDRQAPVAAERPRPQLDARRRLAALVLRAVDERQRPLDDAVVELLEQLLARAVELDVRLQHGIELGRTAAATGRRADRPAARRSAARSIVDTGIELPARALVEVRGPGGRRPS